MPSHTTSVHLWPKEIQHGHIRFVLLNNEWPTSESRLYVKHFYAQQALESSYNCMCFEAETIKHMPVDKKFARLNNC